MDFWIFGKTARAQGHNFILALSRQNRDKTFSPPDHSSLHPSLGWGFCFLTWDFLALLVMNISSISSLKRFIR